MTKRLISKRKPYLQSGVDLWGKAERFWPDSNGILFGPGQQKRNHQTSERVMKLPLFQYVQKLVQCGYVTAECSQEMNVSFAEPKYSSLLKEKQKLKKFYANLTEKQFQKLYHIAKKMPGEVSDNFIALLEKRLDTILFRSNLAVSFFQARQMINHKHVLVNSKVINIPSYQLKKGDLIQVCPSFYNSCCHSHSIDEIQLYYQDTPYLESNYETFSCVLLETPVKEQIYYPFSIDFEKVIRFYK